LGPPLFLLTGIEGRRHGGLFFAACPAMLCQRRAARPFPIVPSAAMQKCPERKLFRQSLGPRKWRIRAMAGPSRMRRRMLIESGFALFVQQYSSIE